MGVLGFNATQTPFTVELAILSALGAAAACQPVIPLNVMFLRIEPLLIWNISDSLLLVTPSSDKPAAG